MAAPFKKNIKMLLEKGCDFQIGLRKGRVLELRPEGYFVFWEPWTDPDSGECHESTAGIYSYDAIVTDNNYGVLKILKRPLVQPTASDRIRRSERVLAEVARQKFRKQYVLAIQGMLDRGELNPVRDDFCAKIITIIANGGQRYREYLAALSMRETKRGGTKVQKTKKAQDRAVEFHQGFKCGHTMWKWYRAWVVNGDDGLFDKYRNCGRYKRYNDATDSFIERHLDMLWDCEKPTITSFVESVQAAINAENERRERLPVPAIKLRRPGYDYIRDKIRELAPINHALRRNSRDKAYKDLHTLGMGVMTSRVLERVEVDEYTVDLFVLMRETGLFDHLPQTIKQLIGLDGKASRVSLSGAIDVHTRCFVALQIVPQGVESPLARTLEMIYMDKSPIADAAGARFGWPMGGAPESIVFDRGDKYISDDAYEVLADLGITNLGCPAGKPWLKPYIKRVFRTVHNDLLLRFSGRAFSNVVERGENDAAARATLTLEAFLCWLVRWVVDAYHTKEHSALGMSPAQAWERGCKECPPRSLTSDEMREVFGVRTRRKLTRKGVLVHKIDYQSDALMHMCLTEKVDDVEILRWDGDIGTISVRAGIGSWMTVPACDERWIGKSELEMLAELAEEDDADAADIDAECLARRDFINDGNRESYRLKRVMGLISLPKTVDELEYETQRFMRHTDTAERRHKAGPHRPLMGDLDGTAPTDTTPAANHAHEETTADHHVQADDDNHTME
ncbi:Integrase core domain protein [Tritonibacter multivorans]|uniref:Integrase core domain protein n=1 Tax=Tritonibacter multivorans TaxID=928856 RepID=A0A0P1G8Q0_9RHOB|nr:DDE-type integrase/transposase/recombinase [Tritonibacter multivorans]MDA7422209.1 DDE-type integrase/transposase/recombinase [Tritonibacter multivorans]CUH77910.1 Integrase core domain protein [Tritonibacter multivorans]SFD10114.1 Integrase core domain-containing protein [Tritonibacter multivorans]